MRFETGNMIAVANFLIREFIVVVPVISGTKRVLKTASLTIQLAGKKSNVVARRDLIQLKIDTGISNLLLPFLVGR
jgi:hypothetical protein